MTEKRKKAENNIDEGAHDMNRRRMKSRKRKASEECIKEQTGDATNVIRKDKKEKRKGKGGEGKKKRLPLKRTAANNLFALKILWKSSPSYLIIYLASSFIYGILGFCPSLICCGRL